MSFKSLEDRFNEKVNTLYAGAKTKFDGGKPSTGRNDDPLIVRKPGDGFYTVADKIGGRSLPINSSLQDVKRLTLFTLSVRGIAFLAKQQLLQTGNTFEQTRIINPVFAVGNAVPFLHLRRHLRPLNTLLKKTDTSYANVRKLGQLQKSTYTSFTESAGGGGVKGFFKKIAGPITSTISAITAKKNVGDEFGYDDAGWAKTRPELGQRDSDYVVSFNAPKFRFGGNLRTETFSGQMYGAITNGVGNWNGNYTTYINLTDGSKKFPPQIFRRHFPFNVSPYNDIVLSDTATERRLQRKYDDFKFDEPLKAENNNPLGSDIPTILKKIRENYQQDKQNWYENDAGGEGIMPYLRYFIGDNQSITDGRQFDPSDGDLGTNAQELAKTRPDKTKKISYIKDPSNFEVVTNKKVLEPYKYINGDADGFTDAITVSFAMANDEPIKFRAFITDLNESVNPTYNSFQYIGRVEKFVNYTGVQRELSFKLGILAFSKDELNGVWRRINYLTGLAFPYGFTKGILQPNIMRLTIGKVYVDQPGYISSISKNFKDISETWDLDEEVPIGATLDMKFTVIEKTTKLAESPFHGITEDMYGFNKTIPSPDKVSANLLDPAKAPSVKSITTNVDVKKPEITSGGFLLKEVPKVYKLDNLNINLPGIG